MKKMYFLTGIIALFMVLTTLETSVFAQEAPKEEKPNISIGGYIDLIASVRFGDSKNQLGKSNFNLYLFGINFDGDFGRYGFHALINVTGTGKGAGSSSTKNFGDYDYPIWLEEGFVYANLMKSDKLNMQLKVGSIYNPFGLQGDNSWYFAGHYYAGLSVDADYGTVLDTTYNVNDKMSFNVALGYYLVSDQQNGTRNAGFGVDPEGKISGTSWTEERDTFVGRLAGTFGFGPVGFTAGGSLMAGTVNEALNTASSKDSKQFNIEGDLTVNVKLLNKENFLVIFGEYISAQRNKNNVDFNSDGTVENWNFNAFVVGTTINFLQDVQSDWLNSMNFHFNYTNVTFHGNGSTKGPDLWIYGLGAGLTSELTLNLEYVRGRNDRALGHYVSNYFDEGFFIDMFYSF